MKSSLWRLLGALSVLALSVAEAHQFASDPRGADENLLEELALYAPFSPVGIAYAKGFSPYWGVPLNLLLLVLLWTGASLVGQRPWWKRRALLGAEWLLATLASTWYLMNLLLGL